MITEDYVSFETAKLLKEKGFNEDCRAFYKEWNREIIFCPCTTSHLFEYCHNSMLEYYNDKEETNIAAPTLQMAMKWLREVCKIQIEILIVGEEDKEIFAATRWVYGWRIQSPKFIDRHQCTFTSHEQACEAAIKYCLENLI